jgi:hypothetical protein
MLLLKVLEGVRYIHGGGALCQEYWTRVLLPHKKNSPWRGGKRDVPVQYIQEGEKKPQCGKNEDCMYMCQKGVK